VKTSWKNIAEPVVFFIVLLVLWEILVEVIKVPAFILPPPRDLWVAFFKKLPILGNHALITFIEAFGGFVLSLVLGVGFAIAVVYSRHLQNTIYPLIVILYAMPKSAFAPLMVIWVGYGLYSKIAIAFLVAFFPIVVNTVVGLKEVEPELLELARINRGSDLDVFKKIRLPNSLPYMFAGIKVAIVLSVTGAIVAEFRRQRRARLSRPASQLQLGYGICPGDSSYFSGIVAGAVLVGGNFAAKAGAMERGGA
jgi:NitT/TauT family transport system permease protein